MTKKDTIVIIGCVILFLVLVALLYLEIKNPEGGVAFIENLVGSITG